MPDSDERRFSSNKTTDQSNRSSMTVDQSLQSIELLNKKNSITDGLNAGLTEMPDTSGDVSRIFIIIIPTLLAVAILASIGMAQAKIASSLAGNLKENVQTAEAMRNLLTKMRKERGLTCLRASVVKSEKEEIDAVLSLAAKETNTALAQLTKNEKLKTRRIWNITKQVAAVRSGKDHHTCQEIIEKYTKVTLELQYEMCKEFFTSEEGTFWNYIGHFDNIIHANDLIGLKRALGSSMYGNGRNGEKERTEFIKIDAMGQFMFEHTKTFLPSIRSFSKILEEKNAKLITTLNIMDSDITKDSRLKPSSTKALEYFGNMTQLVKMITDIEDAISTNVRKQLTRKSDRNNRRFWTQVVILICICIICPAMCLVYAVHTARLIRRCRNSSNEILRKGREIQGTRQKTDLFLNRILPMLQKLTVQCDCDCNEANHNKAFLSELRNQILDEAWGLRQSVADGESERPT